MNCRVIIDELFGLFGQEMVKEMASTQRYSIYCHRGVNKYIKILEAGIREYFFS